MNIRTYLFSNHMLSYISHSTQYTGDPVSLAIAEAVLTAVEEERLQEHARQLGEYIRAGLRRIATEHPCVGDVRFVCVGGVMVGDWRGCVCVSECGGWVVRCVLWGGVRVGGWRVCVCVSECGWVGRCVLWGGGEGWGLEGMCVCE